MTSQHNKNLKMERIYSPKGFGGVIGRYKTKDKNDQLSRLVVNTETFQIKSIKF